jgi:hypothetical protein
MRAASASAYVQRIARQDLELDDCPVTTWNEIDDASNYRVDLVGCDNNGALHDERLVAGFVEEVAPLSLPRSWAACSSFASIDERAARRGFARQLDSDRNFVAASDDTSSSHSP